MLEIKGLAEVEARLGQLSRSRDGLSLTFTRFQAIRECHLSEQDCEGHARPRFDLVVESTLQPSTCRMRIILWGAQSLSMKQISVGSTTSGLEIRDISNRHWQNRSWELKDYENDLIHCYAEEVEILLEPSGKSATPSTGGSG